MGKSWVGGKSLPYSSRSHLGPTTGAPERGVFFLTKRGTDYVGMELLRI